MKEKEQKIIPLFTVCETNVRKTGTCFKDGNGVMLWFLLQPAFNVALEAVVLGALDSGTLEEGAVLLFGEALPVVGCHLQERFGRLEGRLVGGLGFGELWCGTQAAVAAVEGAFELYLLGEWAVMFYGQVADAATGIKAFGREGWAEKPPSTPP